MQDNLTNYGFGKKMSRESNSITPGMVSARNEISRPTLLSSYDLKDVFDAYEFGLFYKCMTNKKCQQK